MRVIKGKHHGLWSAIDVLYYYCPLCGMHTSWQKYHGTTTLVATCCGYVFQAKPLNESSRFEVFVNESDMSNVIVLSAIAY